FMDSRGQEVMEPTFVNINEDYKCGLVEADVLATSEGLVARNGKRITSFQKINEPLGLGFWKVGDTTCMRVVHASGRLLANHCAEDAQLIGNRFFWLKGKSQSGVYSLAGRLLLKGNWDEVSWAEDVLVLTQWQKKTIVTMQQMKAAAEGLVVKSDHVYDDVRAVGTNRLLVRNGALEGIIDSNGRFIVPLARQVLTLEPFGLVRKVNDVIFLDEVDKQFVSRQIKKYNRYRHWLSISTNTESLVWDLRAKRFLPRADSTWFAAGLLFAKQADSVNIHFNFRNTLSFRKDQRVTLIPSRDSIRAFFVNEGKLKKSVFAVTEGLKLFTAEFDQIESIDQGLFLVTRKGKKGVLSKNGKVLVAIEYDLLAFNRGRCWSTFKDKKFGLVNLATGELLKPISTRNVSLLGKTKLVVYQKDKCALVNWQGKNVTPFEYDELLPWSGQFIWARKNFSWSLIDIVSQKMIVSNVKRFDKWLDQEQSKIYRIQKDEFFGVVTTEKGLVIPPSFSLVKNIGSQEQPLYLTDKEVEEAGVHVVIYYNADGKFIRK
ncbi:MAG: WG repeat-containing protein, partial [Flammeovirgaceae bacterium]